ncbi:hypothetical protein GCM10011581_40420 [Saccharopolyspora subtropica]|uniref:Bacteriophage T5 Orf172 DNA-binding domain-containing protein n=1 Tax=Saccharopolyspora thermophila TaxID=89367 RepID=A0A917NGC6_9PSEU|nr:DUF4041 domain-containing protein [Saccharopolyspora subtropica]GGI99146.1 hypothetical protein GCM10011581_40420 [Saccharopolyspora subtropica]
MIWGCRGRRQVQVVVDERIEVALSGNNDEVAELQQQLAEAHGIIAELRAWTGQLRGTETAALEAELRQLRSAVHQSRSEYSVLSSAEQQLRAEVDALRAQVVETREVALLQEVGSYEYAHPLDDALAYQDMLAALRQRIRNAARTDAVTCHVDWSGPTGEGRELARDMAKLMLRAYNIEADHAVRSVTPHTRDAVKTRLTTSRDTIARLGASLHITISANYHSLRLREIDLTADHLAKVADSRERAWAHRERLREDAKVAQEIARERARLAKERARYAGVVAKLAAIGDAEALARARKQLASVKEAIAGVEQRAANARAGYVYVVSNIGAFGPDMVKIGMTRRLDPMDRIRELGEDSVPFRFDTHALFFATDAVSLTTALHQRLAHKRVNLVNPRCEFFRATPAEVRDVLVELGEDHVLEYTDTAQAVEWRVSSRLRSGPAGAAVPAFPATADLATHGGARP